MLKRLLSIVTLLMGFLLYSEYGAAQQVPKDDRFGFVGGSDDSELPLSSAAGVGWIRIGMNWQQLEPTKGSYNMPDSALHRLQQIQAYGLKLCLCVAGSNSNYAYDGTDYVQGYAKVMAWLARNYSQYIGALEVMNEPLIDWQFPFVSGNRGNWSGINDDETTSNWLLRYLPMLDAAADAVKATNPSMQIIGSGGSASANLRGITLGLSGNLDGMVDHPYSQNNPSGPMQVTMPEIVPWANWYGWTEQGTSVTDAEGSFWSMVDNFRSHATRFGATTHIWHTEFGYSTVEPNPPDYPSGMTEEVQATYLARRLLEAAGVGVEHTFIYTLEDWDADPYNTDTRFGMLKWDFSPKMSYYALQHITQLLANGTTPERGTALDSSISGDPTDPNGLGYRCYTFSSNDKSITTVAFWEAVSVDQSGNSASRSVTITIPRSTATSSVTLTNVLSGASSDVGFSTDPDGSVTASVVANGTPQVLSLFAR